MDIHWVDNPFRRLQFVGGRDLRVRHTLGADYTYSRGSFHFGAVFPSAEPQAITLNFYSAVPKC